jgi:hypothetical protein
MIEGAVRSATQTISVQSVSELPLVIYHPDSIKSEDLVETPSSPVVLVSLESSKPELPVETSKRVVDSKATREEKRARESVCFFLLHKICSLFRGFQSAPRKSSSMSSVASLDLVFGFQITQGTGASYVRLHFPLRIGNIIVENGMD